MTSGLVDVETTAPVAQRMLGMMSDVVFPDRGGPSNRSTTLPILMYDNAFNNFDIGQGNAIERHV